MTFGLVGRSHVALPEYKQAGPFNPTREKVRRLFPPLLTSRGDLSPLGTVPTLDFNEQLEKMDPPLPGKREEIFAVWVLILLTGHTTHTQKPRFLCFSVDIYDSLERETVVGSETRRKKSCRVLNSAFATKSSWVGGGLGRC